MWMAFRSWSLSWAMAERIARARSSSEIGRAPRDTLPATRRPASCPPAVVTVTPCTRTSAMLSARSTAWATASEASSILMIAPFRTPRDCTWATPEAVRVRSTRRTPSGFMMKQATLLAPRSTAAVTWGRPRATFSPSRDSRLASSMVTRHPQSSPRLDLRSPGV